MTAETPVPPPPPPTDVPPPPAPGSPAEPTPDERTWATMAHASALIAMVVGGLMILGPLVVWLIKKNESAYVDYHGKEALNFQITMFGVDICAVVVGIATCGIGLIVLLPLVVLANIILTILAAMAANRGEMYRYPFTLRLVK